MLPEHAITLHYGDDGPLHVVFLTKPVGLNRALVTGGRRTPKSDQAITLFLEQVITRWNRIDRTDNPLPVTLETIMTLPWRVRRDVAAAIIKNWQQTADSQTPPDGL